MTELGDVGDSLHVVFGATGAIGRAVVAELLHVGRDVRAVSRGGQAPGGAQGMAADAADPGQAVRAAVGAAVIYHCASPPYTQWPELFPALIGCLRLPEADAAPRRSAADRRLVSVPLTAGHSVAGDRADIARCGCEHALAHHAHRIPRSARPWS
jgi:uncharacterized protein YbjT (DUF2867 family)